MVSDSDGPGPTSIAFAAHVLLFQIPQSQFPLGCQGTYNAVHLHRQHCHIPSTFNPAVISISGSNSYHKLEAVINMQGINNHTAQAFHNSCTLLRRSIHFKWTIF